MIEYICNKISRVKVIFRNFIWSNLFKRFGEGSQIFGKIIIYYPKNVEFGDHSTLNEGVLLNARAKIKIGNYVHISPYCIINTGGLDYKKIMRDRTHVSSPIIINDGVWIGSGAIINPGVSIGKNSVIGSGSVVTKNIPDNCLAFGNPAKVKKKINE